nr:MFS transporter [Candidatus Phycosocius spiralis]
MLRAMMADVGDEDLLQTGQDRTGFFYALVTLIGKAVSAVAVGVTYIGLGLIGFDSNLGTQNSSLALTGLTFLFIGVPIIVSLIGTALLLCYLIDFNRTIKL